MRIKLLTAIVSVAALVALTPPANAGQSFPSELDFDGVEFPGKGTVRFYGDLASEGPGKCTKDRRVRMFVASDGGSPTQIGSTRTDSFRNWSLQRSSSGLLPGDYFARVAKRKLANGTVCKPDKSNLILIT
jgi:hypothetical protein